MGTLQGALESRRGFRCGIWKPFIEKGMNDKNVIHLQNQHLYLAMLISTPAVIGEYESLKFSTDYTKALKHRKND